MVTTRLNNCVALGALPTRREVDTHLHAGNVPKKAASSISDTYASKMPSFIVSLYVLSVTSLIGMPGMKLLFFLHFDELVLPKRTRIATFALCDREAFPPGVDEPEATAIKGGGSAVQSEATTPSNVRSTDRKGRSSADMSACTPSARSCSRVASILPARRTNQRVFSTGSPSRV